MAKDGKKRFRRKEGNIEEIRIFGRMRGWLAGYLASEVKGQIASMCKKARLSKCLYSNRIQFQILFLF